jgi:hypothetical protein
VTPVVVIVLVTETSVPPLKSVSTTNGLSTGPPQLMAMTSAPPVELELELLLDELLLDELLELLLDELLELLELDDVELWLDSRP